MGDANASRRQCSHPPQNWKARLSAYTDVIAKAAKTASDTDPFFRPYLDGSLL
jgi:cytoskeleton-associated protein 5